ncbi:MAG: histidine phosphatase family protein [Oscillospiraceae bacterium]|nr:histidine phosphatase family protein [Oscillospiraceae bacterium]
MKLTLIRHSITEGNLRRLYYGSADIPLAPEGEALLRTLRETHRYPTAEYYCTSGMLRTEQTFSLIYGTQAHDTVPALREMDFGAFEMRTYEELKDDPLYQAWLEGDHLQNLCPNGESAVGFFARVRSGILPLISADKDTVCVTHGGVIAALMLHWFEGKNYYEWMPEPAYGYEIELKNGVPVSYRAIPNAR